MATAHTKLFKSNRSQAVRLPKKVALPESVKEVDIVAIGNRRIITPAETLGDDWFDEARVSSDFMLDREQPDDQYRENF
ncbi:MAG: antitoxin [gamma proteobacterium symbiont of Bathyaustriella thionipta]|nr:antitoxin [gamma proteobacterium symbiont of Bathyaustriella thionipta]